MDKNITDLLYDNKFFYSKRECKYMVLIGGVYVNDRLVNNPREMIPVKKGTVIRVGKCRTVRL
jgi:tyrosyl-tRNA synthetase